jgi:hypothetical protein
MQTGGRLHGNPLLMAIETNGGRTGKVGVIFLLFIDEFLNPNTNINFINEYGAEPLYINQLY